MSNISHTILNHYESGEGISKTIDFLLSDPYFADAALNLYEIDFEPNYGEYKGKSPIYSCRTNNIQIPKRVDVITNVYYKNVEIPKVSNGTEQDKTLQFTLRLDRDYVTVKAFEKSLTRDINGELKNNFDWTITVYAYGNDLTDTNDDWKPKRTWTFNKCKVVDIASYNYDYTNTNAPTTTVSFIWCTCDEC